MFGCRVGADGGFEKGVEGRVGEFQGSVVVFFTQVDGGPETEPVPPMIGLEFILVLAEEPVNNRLCGHGVLKHKVFLRP